MSLGAEARARLARGAGAEAVYRLVQDALGSDRFGVLLDVGCGTGSLYPFVRARVDRYIGADIVRYEQFPAAAEFREVNLERGALDIESNYADVVACVETIEHVENPRALMRELVRVVRPGGVVLITTPNQLSLASKLCLLTRNEFLHFQERPGLYPAHISALLEVDLRRLARECSLERVAIRYSGDGRIPLSARHWPAVLSSSSGIRGRAFSDNVLLMARKPASP